MHASLEFRVDFVHRMLTRSMATCCKRSSSLAPQRTRVGMRSIAALAIRRVPAGKVFTIKNIAENELYQACHCRVPSSSRMDPACAYPVSCPGSAPRKRGFDGGGRRAGLAHLPRARCRRPERDQPHRPDQNPSPLIHLGQVHCGIAACRRSDAPDRAHASRLLCS